MYTVHCPDLRLTYLLTYSLMPPYNLFLMVIRNSGYYLDSSFGYTDSRIPSYQARASPDENNKLRPPGISTPCFQRLLAFHLMRLNMSRSRITAMNTMPTFLRC